MACEERWALPSWQGQVPVRAFTENQGFWAALPGSSSRGNAGRNLKIFWIGKMGSWQVLLIGITAMLVTVVILVAFGIDTTVANS